MKTSSLLGLRGTFSLMPFHKLIKEHGTTKPYRATVICIDGWVRSDRCIVNYASRSDMQRERARERMERARRYRT